MSKLYTIVHVHEEIEVTPFVHIYSSHKAAMSAVETAALEDWEYLVDPNNDDPQKFPGLSWSDDKNEASLDWDNDSISTWTITECELHQ